MALSKESQDMIITIRETWHRLDGLYEQYAKSLGLSFTALMVLDLLDDSAVTYTQRVVCDRLDLPKQYVNSIIKSLLEQGHVELKEAKDRRNKEIRITERGKLYIQSALKPLDEAEFAAWGGFSQNAITHYAQTMARYTEAFERVLDNLKTEIPAVEVPATQTQPPQPLIQTPQHFDVRPKSETAPPSLRARNSR